MPRIKLTKTHPHPWGKGVLSVKGNYYSQGEEFDISDRDLNGIPDDIEYELLSSRSAPRVFQQVEILEDEFGNRIGEKRSEIIVREKRKWWHYLCVWKWLRIEIGFK